jgi:hypothetical protein
MSIARQCALVEAEKEHDLVGHNLREADPPIQISRLRA